MQPKSLVLQLIKLKLRVVKVFTQEHTGSSYQSLDKNTSLSSLPHCLSEKEEEKEGRKENRKEGRREEEKRTCTSEVEYCWNPHC